MYHKKLKRICCDIRSLQEESKINAVPCHNFLWASFILRKTLGRGTEEPFPEETEESYAELHLVVRVPEVTRYASQEPDFPSQCVPHGGHVDENAVGAKGKDMLVERENLANAPEALFFAHGEDLPIHGPEAHATTRATIFQTEHLHGVSPLLEALYPELHECILCVHFLGDEEERGKYFEKSCIFFHRFPRSESREHCSSCTFPHRFCRIYLFEEGLYLLRKIFCRSISKSHKFSIFPKLRHDAHSCGEYRKSEPHCFDGNARISFAARIHHEDLSFLKFTIHILLFGEPSRERHAISDTKILRPRF